VPTQMSEVEGSVLSTLACSSNRACSSSLDDSGHELQQRRCGRAALLGPHSGAHERWPSGPVHGRKPNTLLCQRGAEAPLFHGVLGSVAKASRFSQALIAGLEAVLHPTSF